MKWCWSLLVVCTGCLQPNPSFKPGSTSGESESASADDTLADIGTAATLTADDDDGDDDGSSGDASASATASTAPTTAAATTEGGSEEGSDGGTTGVAPGEHLIFVSSSDLGGDFGGIPVVDELCTQLATEAGLVGSWRAILSDSTIDARDRIVVSGPVRNSLGELIAEDQADLWDGFIAAPVRYTEDGSEFLANPYTGTNADGTRSSAHCDNWTSTTGDGTIGDAGFGDNIWLAYDNAHCNQNNPFYCISQ